MLLTSVGTVYGTLTCQQALYHDEGQTSPRGCFSPLWVPHVHGTLTCEQALYYNEGQTRFRRYLLTSVSTTCVLCMVHLHTSNLVSWWKIEPFSFSSLLFLRKCELILFFLFFFSIWQCLAQAPKSNSPWSLFVPPFIYFCLPGTIPEDLCVCVHGTDSCFYLMHFPG